MPRTPAGLNRLSAPRTWGLGLALLALAGAACESATEPPRGDPGPVSTDRSVVTVSSGSVQVGGSASVRLQARDAAGRDLTTGGLVVAFAASGGSSQGSFGPTVDQGNGSYQATFTGTLAGTATTVGATINGVAVTSQLPSIQVVAAPTGEVICEAVGSARCWYVAANASSSGNGSFQSPFQVPQRAVERARPGDFIYLRGGAEFTHDHAFVHFVHGSFLAFIMSDVAAGEPGRPITLKSYPGEQAVVRGDFEPGGHLGVRVGKSHWRIEGLRLYQGVIQVGHSGTGLGIRDVWIVGNHISDVIASPGNFGMINVTGQHTQGGPIDHGLDPIDIFVHDNRLHTLWGEQPDGSVLPWDQDVWIEHHACFMLQKSGGLVELLRNEFYECANIFYSKWEGPGPFVARNNHFHTARNIAYRWRSSRPVFEDNVFARFQRDMPSFDMTQGTVEDAVFRRNTFDFGPWSRNPQGGRGVVRWNASPHLFRDNVVFARHYHGAAPPSGSDIDRNCVIWDTSLVAVSGYSWEEYTTAFGHDVHGIHVTETDPAAVFADRGTGNYTLIGQAAEQCAPPEG